MIAAPAIAPNKLEFSTVLTLSTAHITKDDSDALLESASGERQGGFIVMTDPHRVRLMLLVHECLYNNDDNLAEDNGYSPELMALVALARDHKCDWLILHPDGNTVEGLPTFDW